MNDTSITHFLNEVQILQITAIYKAGENGLELPHYQGSTFRGVFGHVFKEVACTCSNQNIHHEHCPYAYIFETRLQDEHQKIISSDDIPRPFIIWAENNNKLKFAPGERFYLTITIFGEAVKYLHYFIYVLFHMGKKGFGKGKQQAELRQVFLVDEDGDFREQIYQHQKIYYNGQILNSEKITSGIKDASTCQLDFISPTRLKYQSHYTDNPEFHIIFRSAVRRITSLLYYHHGRQLLGIDFKELFRKAEEVKLVQSDVSWYDWERYSNRQKKRMKLGGIVGKAVYEGDLDPFIPWLQLAEWTHVGKNTTFGLGKIKALFN
ncbi:CRISPR system precrRNA processing endoribonuclease RAMP protein Cas6 [Bacillus andreraoultii]|uniref:CRISPR system precrRNA processing endoribonuclease RAMP protein Cas6 n=1 Tax=Bacillus andreraoultii TaxID=1499685 RepID=UPI00053BBBD6|nr:CRISPR system precrRNA processing endoribonuclease RAMP protein Cas6 [Bacillus andreraoultii]